MKKHTLQTLCLLDWIEILPLHVFDDGKEHILFIGQLSDQTRNL